MVEEEKLISTPAEQTPEPARKASGVERAATYFLAAAILIIDLITKLLVEDRLGINQSYVPFESL